MENLKPIQDILAKSTTTHGEALKTLTNTIEIVSKELSSEDIANVLMKANRSLEANLNTKRYREGLIKEKHYPEVDKKNLVSYFIARYTDLYGQIIEAEYWVENVYKIAAIISRDLPACEELGVDPKKGILLYGGVGVGKTSIMKCFAIILKMMDNPEYPTYKTVNTIEIANDFKNDGAVCISRYTNILNEGALKNAGWFFDDMGNEDKANNYGNSSNVMEEVIQIIYNKPNLKGRVHFSTNLTDADMKDKYGERVVSRIKEMTNVIVFPSHANDMRLK